MITAYFLLADGFEELEFIAPYDILHRGSVNVKTVSIGSDKHVTGSHGVIISADLFLHEIEENSFDLLVLPGGPGTDNLLKNDAVKELLIKTYNANKKIAAICAAPKVLANAGILLNHEATSYPSVKKEVEHGCKKYLEQSVVISGNIITSRSAGTAADFGFCLLSVLKSPEIASEVKEKMIF